MFKNIILILALTGSVYVVAQRITPKFKSIEVIYAAGTNHPKLVKNTDKVRILKDVEFILRANATTSEFKLIEKNSFNFETNLRYSKSGVGRNDLKYKNIKSKESIHYNNTFFGKGSTNVLEDFKEFDWVLTKETKKIGKYNCYKAEAFEEFLAVSIEKMMTKHVVAWYTPEIPVPFGPAEYSGLPGLVLEVSVNHFYLIANSVTISDKTITIDRPKAEREITEKEAEEAVVNLIKESRKRMKNKN